MGLKDMFKKGHDAKDANSGSASTPSTVTPQATAPAASSGTVNLTKGGTVNLTKQSGGVYTLIAAWGEKDYDLYALVEYADGHVETVSCFGTMQRPNDFSTRTRDGAVVHATGDKTAYGNELPQEVIKIQLRPEIVTVVPVVYSAKNSGTGSFRRYQVSTYVIAGDHDVVPSSGVEMIRVEAVEANSDEHVYTFVPAIIHNGPQGAKLEAVELYSGRSSELRPVVSDGKVQMDKGPENSTK